MRHLIVSIMETPWLVALMGGMLIIPPIYGIMFIHKK
jgi:hypothetical protein